MLFKGLLVASVALSPTIVSGNPISEPLDAPKGIVNIETKTLVARAASDYPLAPGPYPNEFKYENWDPDNSEQKKQLQRIHEAFGEWTKMAMEASSSVNGKDLTTAYRWYGTAEPLSELRGVFANMWNSDAGKAAQPVSTMICDRNDFENFCTKGINAYTIAATGRFHICPAGLAKPLNSEIVCSDLDASCSKKMRSLPMTLLHEMTHYDKIGFAATRIDITDVDDGKGSYDCFVLGEDDKAINAQNYA